MPTIVVCMSGWLSVNRSMNSMRRHVVEQVVEIGLLPPIATRLDHRPEEVGIARQRLVVDRRRAARDATADDRARPGDRRVADRILVLTLQRRVRDLERVEHAHVDVVDRGSAACPTSR